MLNFWEVSILSLNPYLNNLQQHKYKMESNNQIFPTVAII